MSLASMPPMFTEDIKRLLLEASAPVEDRLRTFSEWWNDTDIQARQLANKVQAGQTANTLVKQRLELMTLLADIADRETGERRRQLETQLAELELEHKIAELQSLQSVRLETQRVFHEQKLQNLTNPPPPPPPPVPARERVLTEHRENRSARARAANERLDDFFSDIRLACERRTDIHERALRIRQVLEVYEMDEDALPAEARRILTADEGLRDVS